VATPQQTIDLFLRRGDIAEGRRLAAAVVFAESMLRELGAAGAEWGKALVRLRRLQRDRALPCSN
jgi:hypothetical protein